MSGQLNDVILLLHAPDGSRWSDFMSSRLDAAPYDIRSIAKDITILEGPPEDEDDDGDDDCYDVPENTNSINTERTSINNDGEENEEDELYLNTAEVTDTLKRKKKCNPDNENSFSANPNFATTDELANIPKHNDACERTANLESVNENITTVNSGCEDTNGSKGTENATDNDSKNSKDKPSQGDNNQPHVTTQTAMKLTHASSLEDCLLYSRACIIFLSPDILEGDIPFTIDLTMLNPRSTVFLFLGVDIQLVRQFFAESSDLVFKCRCCHIDGSQVSIRDALLQIVQAYEDPGGSGSGSGSDSHDVEEDEGSGCGTYHWPSSVQANRVEKIFPRELIGDDRDVYVLLEKKPEEAVVAEIGVSQTALPLTQVCDRLYSFTVPENLSGQVPFTIGSAGHAIGSDSVRVLSKLDQVREILVEETDPRSLLSKAFGVAPEDDGGLDTALAFRLQQLASARTLADLFPVEAGLATCASTSQVMYPSLLHFAADHNLRAFCQELLRYPGMIGAAQATNSQGLTPQQLAVKNDFRHLANDLEQYCSKHQKSLQASTQNDEDSNDELYVQPSSTHTTLPPPRPHRTAQRSGYVNSGVESYITMQDLQPEKDKHDIFDVHHQLSQIERGRSAGGREFPGSTHFRNDVDASDGPVGYKNLDTFRLESNIVSSQKNPKTGTMTKFKSLFNIGKSKGKRSSSITDIESAQIKVGGSGRRVSGRRGSQTSTYSKKKDVPEERDSGSYSDEEKEKMSPPPVSRRNNKQKVFKERDQAMSRRLSRRAQATYSETIDMAPTLPSRTGRRKGAFKSFVGE